MDDHSLPQTAISGDDLARSLNYSQYRGLVSQLFQEGKNTGSQQHPKLVHYTELNIYRMSRLDKTTVLKESLVQLLQMIPDPWIWLVLSEGWCPDSAQNIPVLAKMAEASQNIELKLLLRDENPEVMDQYLTDGSRSIPKLICLKAGTLEEIGTWGPRPAVVQQMVMEYKHNPKDISKDDFMASVQTWYARDKTSTLQNEFEALLKEWIKK